MLHSRKPWYLHLWPWCRYEDRLSFADMRAMGHSEPFEVTFARERERLHRTNRGRATR